MCIKWFSIVILIQYYTYPLFSVSIVLKTSLSCLISSRLREWARTFIWQKGEKGEKREKREKREKIEDREGRRVEGKKKERRG